MSLIFEIKILLFKGGFIMREKSFITAVTFTILFLCNVSIHGQCTPQCDADPDLTRTPSGTCCYEFPEGAYPTSGVLPYLELRVYKLSEEQEKQFSDSDNSLSTFWKAWDNNFLDFVELSPTKDGNRWRRSKFDYNSDNDGNMKVYAAYSSKGIYLYFKVTDNNFVDAIVRKIYDPIKDEFGDYEPQEILWANDAIDVFFDLYPNSYLKDHPEKYINPLTGRFTLETKQIQSRFGSGNNVTTFSYNSFNLDLENPWEITRDNEFNEITKEKFNGLTADKFIISENVRGQEWFIPFAEIGQLGYYGGGIVIGNPLRGRLAFCFGYNDADGSEGFNCLRWRNAGDPSLKRREPAASGSDHVPVEPWGDLVFTADTLPTVSITNKMRAMNLKSLNAQKIELYNLTGRKIASVNADQGIDIRSSGVTVQRVIGENNRTLMNQVIAPQKGELKIK